MAKASFTWGRAAVGVGAALLLMGTSCDDKDLGVYNATDEAVIVRTEGVVTDEGVIIDDELRGVQVGPGINNRFPVGDNTCLGTVTVRARDSGKLIATIEGSSICYGDTLIVDASGAYEQPRGSVLPQIIGILGILLVYLLIRRRQRKIDNEVAPASNADV